jgi:hypothetical protein
MSRHHHDMTQEEFVRGLLRQLDKDYPDNPREEKEKLVEGVLQKCLERGDTFNKRKESDFGDLFGSLNGTHGSKEASPSEDMFAEMTKSSGSKKSDRSEFQAPQGSSPGLNSGSKKMQSGKSDRGFDGLFDELNGKSSGSKKSESSKSEPSQQSESSRSSRAETARQLPDEFYAYTETDHDYSHVPDDEMDDPTAIVQKEAFDEIYQVYRSEGLSRQEAKRMANARIAKVVEDFKSGQFSRSAGRR